MATWQISNLYKKEAVERQYWTKGDITIIKEEGFRWGYWSCESDEQPDIALDNSDPEGYDVFSSDYDWDMEEMDDGCWLNWQFPDSVSEEEQERIKGIWDEDWFEGLESDGWTNDETDHVIYGPIKLVNKDTGEEFTGK
jgi:hypothetical protein